MKNITKTIFRKCCAKNSKYIVVYGTEDEPLSQVFLVCKTHSEFYIYNVGIMRIFDYNTKKELLKRNTICSL